MTLPIVMPTANDNAAMRQMYAMWLMQQAAQQNNAQNPQQPQALFDAYSKQQAVEAQIALERAEAAQAAAKQIPAPVMGDGKDDGHISFGKKLLNIGKGIGNMFKGMFFDEKGFSISRTIKTVAITAGAVALTVATGGAAAPFLITAGVAMGGIQVGKGIYHSCKAKTDAEEERAWQEIGAGGATIALSAAGAKGAMKAAGGTVSEGNAITSAVKATGECFKYSGEAVLNAAKAPKSTFAPLLEAETWAAAGSKLKTAWTKNTSTEALKSRYKEILGKPYEKQIAKLTKSSNKLADEIAKLESKPTTPEIEASIAQKKTELTNLLENIETIKTQKANINDNIAALNRDAEITNIQNEIKSINSQIAEAKRLNPDVDLTVLNKELAAKIKLYQEVKAQQTLVGTRETRIKEYKDLIKDRKEALKDATAEQKAVYKQEIKEAKLRIAEEKRFQKVEAHSEALVKANSRTEQLQAALEKVKSKINEVENGTLAPADKAIEIAKLNGIKAKVETNLNIQKALANTNKSWIYFQNGKQFVMHMPKDTRNMTVSLNVGSNQNGFIDETEKQIYLQQLEAYNQAQLDAVQQMLNAQQLAQQQIQTPQPEMYNPYSTNSYGSNPWNSALPTSNFMDYYQSPYPEYI